MTGFGCDGNAFNVDAVSGNGRMWDFEGMTLATSIRASAQQVASGEQVTVAGSVTDGSGRITGDPLVLQSRAPGVAEWTDESPLTYMGPDGYSRATVTVTETREFRWLRPESEYADAGASEPVLVTVEAAEPAPAEPAPEQNPHRAERTSRTRTSRTRTSRTRTSRTARTSRTRTSRTRTSRTRTSRTRTSRTRTSRTRTSRARTSRDGRTDWLGCRHGDLTQHRDRGGRTRRPGEQPRPRLLPRVRGDQAGPGGVLPRGR